MQHQFNKIEFVPLNKHPRWQADIIPMLQNLAAMKYNGLQVISILKCFRSNYGWRRAYQKGSKQLSFRALHIEYKQELPDLCKQLAQFLLTYKPLLIPMLYSQIAKSETYSKKQIYYLLVLMFFCLIPKQYSDGKEQLQHQFSHMGNFAHIFTYSTFKTKCIVQYFKKECQRMNSPMADNRMMTIIREVGQTSIEKIFASHKGQLMQQIKIQSDNANIESYVGEVKVDFANRYIGGGCLTYGCVQEEIMFAVRPQLLATTLLCEKLQGNEALAFVGFPKIFKSKGYAADTQYNGFEDYEYQYIQGGKFQKQVKEYIVGIDAIKFKIRDPVQFTAKLLNREIIKAYTGFTTIPIKASIVSGNWGCGVFNGDHLTKLVIQWIAASLAQRQLKYCPFGKKKMIEEHDLLQNFRNKQVRLVYDMLLRAGQMKTDAQFNKVSMLSLMSDLLFKENK